MTRSFYALPLLLALTQPSAWGAKTIISENPTTKLKSWKQVEKTFSIELIQLLPEFVQATFSARDLPPTIFASMKDYCIFGTVVRNESQGEISYRVADWRYQRAMDNCIV